MTKFRWNRQGSKNPNAKLTDEQVRQIMDPANRNRYGMGRALARKFGVSEGLIYAIRGGDRWGHMGRKEASPAKKRR